MKLQDRVAVVTGGGTGIGRGISLAFGREGAKVVVNYSKSRDDANAAVAEICAAGGSAIALASDVSIDAEARAMMEDVGGRFGRIDVLVNNAGWSTRIPHERLEDLTDEIWNRTLDTNLRGAFYCMRAAAPWLRKQPGSAIINVASVAGLTGSGSSIAYAASKGGLLTMTKSLARVLAPDVRVNAIAPGFVRTRFANWPSSAFDDGEAITPMGKLPTADEIGAMAVYLAADATATTGETIVVDGGLSELGPHRQRS
jgi:3-oxoacyl-[acyl-carrier protein] reductase